LRLRRRKRTQRGGNCGRKRQQFHGFPQLGSYKPHNDDAATERKVSIAVLMNWAMRPDVAAPGDSY
jgi:hypothetical protein